MLLDAAHYAGWYERRKRAVLLACLTRSQFQSGFEPGCGYGFLTAELSPRCRSLLAMDGDRTAVASTRRAVANAAHVNVCEGRVPFDWPAHQCFDLIVLSEFLYYVPKEALTTIAQLARASLTQDGEIVACHWRHQIPECDTAGDVLQERFGDALDLPAVSHVTDPDFDLCVWRRRGRGVAFREGLLA